MSAIEASSVSMKTMADGTLRVTFDIEPRNAQAAFALFGAPGTPAALAALKVGHAAKADAPAATESPKGGQLAKLAGMWCSDRQFADWIRPIYDRAMGGKGNAWGDVTPEHDFKGRVNEWCAHALYVLCDIKSRVELDNDVEAAERFHRVIRGPYMKHLQARGVAA